MSQIMKILGYAGMVGGTLYILEAVGVFSIKSLMGKNA